jgi:hypothetical protein
MAELRLVLICAGIAKENIRTTLFNTFEDKEIISIHELERVLTRKPLTLPKTTANTIARYLIEPQNQTMLEYNELREKEFNEVINKLMMLIDDYKLCGNDAEVKESIARKLVGKYEVITKFKETSAVNIKSALSKIGVELKKEEEDYLMVVMYKRSKEDNKVSVIDLLLELYQALPQSEKSQSREYSSKKLDEDDLMIDEEKMAKITQSLFVRIAKKALAKGVSLQELYGPKLIREEVQGEVFELMSSDDFIAGLQSLGIDNLQPLERACLIKVLAVSEDERFIKFDDLMEILSEYGIGLASEPTLLKKTESKVDTETIIDFNKLDNISVIIMFALNEYLSRIDLPLERFLGNKIHKQTVQMKSSKKTVDLINSEDFFEILEEIGVGIEDKEYMNLQTLLCIDSTYKDKLSIDKIRKVIDEFNSNDNFRNKALEFYKEMAKDVSDEDDIEDHMLAYSPGNSGHKENKKELQDEYMEQFVF